MKGGEPLVLVEKQQVQWDVEVRATSWQRVGNELDRWMAMVIQSSRLVEREREVRMSKGRLL